MIKQTLVRFDHAERDLLKKAYVHIRVAYPDYDTLPDRDERTRPGRALSALSKGEAATQALAERAFAATQALLAACVEQSSADYWRARLLQPVAGAPEGPPIAVQRRSDAPTVPLIGDPDGVCRMLAETRGSQARDARDALDILAAALPLFADDRDFDRND